VSWWYRLMSPSLFLAVQEGLEVASSPHPRQGGEVGWVLHLLCEFAPPNTIKEDRVKRVD
jgi:hypothetical protein